MDSLPTPPQTPAIPAVDEQAQAEMRLMVTTIADLRAIAAKSLPRLHGGEMKFLSNYYTYATEGAEAPVQVPEKIYSPKNWQNVQTIRQTLANNAPFVAQLAESFPGKNFEEKRRAAEKAVSYRGICLARMEEFIQGIMGDHWANYTTNCRVLTTDLVKPTGYVQMRNAGNKLVDYCAEMGGIGRSTAEVVLREIKSELKTSLSEHLPLAKPNASGGR